MSVYDVIAYRREAEHHVGSDENLYRFEWVRFIFVSMGILWVLNLHCVYRMPN